MKGVMDSFKEYTTLELMSDDNNVRNNRRLTHNFLFN